MVEEKTLLFIMQVVFVELCRGMPVFVRWLCPIFSSAAFLMLVSGLFAYWQMCCKALASGSEMKFIMQNMSPACHCVGPVVSKIGGWNSTELLRRRRRAVFLAGIASLEEEMVWVKTWVILKTIEQNASESVSFLDRKGGEGGITIITHRCTCTSLYIRVV